MPRTPWDGVRKPPSKFQEGDVSNLHELKDRTFDLVVTILERCSRQSRSMAPRRWCAEPAPEGGFVMGNWIPNDATLVALWRIPFALFPLESLEIVEHGSNQLLSARILRIKGCCKELEKVDRLFCRFAPVRGRERD